MGWITTALAVWSAAKKLGPLAKDLWPLLTAIVAVIANHLAGGPLPLSPTDSAGAVAAGAAVSYHLRVARRLKSLLHPRRA